MSKGAPAVAEPFPNSRGVEVRIGKTGTECERIVVGLTRTVVSAGVLMNDAKVEQASHPLGSTGPFDRAFVCTGCGVQRASKMVQRTGLEPCSGVLCMHAQVAFHDCLGLRNIPASLRCIQGRAPISTTKNRAQRAGRLVKGQKGLSSVGVERTSGISHRNAPTAGAEPNCRGVGMARERSRDTGNGHARK